jgi:hypothetical protein
VTWCLIIKMSWRAPAKTVKAPRASRGGHAGCFSGPDGNLPGFPSRPPAPTARGPTRTWLVGVGRTESMTTARLDRALALFVLAWCKRWRARNAPMSPVRLPLHETGQSSRDQFTRVRDAALRAERSGYGMQGKEVNDFRDGRRMKSRGIHLHNTCASSGSGRR